MVIFFLKVDNDRKSKGKLGTASAFRSTDSSSSPTVFCISRWSSIETLSVGQLGASRTMMSNGEEGGLC